MDEHDDYYLEVPDSWYEDTRLDLEPYEKLARRDGALCD